MHLRNALAGIVVGLWLVGLVASKAAAGPEGQISEGASMARDACSACHQVSPDQKPPPPVFDQDQEVGIIAPSFMKIASNPRNNAARLRKVIAEPHYPMREQMLDPEDRNALIAYIISLRPIRPAQ
jgi:mono/diheme cytochrome c family protein